MFTGADVIYDFKFTAKSKRGEYFFNRFIKTHDFLEVNKDNNVYTGYASLRILNNLSTRHLYKVGILDLGKAHFDKVVIKM